MKCVGCLDCSPQSEERGFGDELSCAVTESSLKLRR